MLLWRTRSISVNSVSRTDSIVRHDEADVCVIILSDKVDVVVLLVYWCQKVDVSCAVQMERWRDGVGMFLTSTQQLLHLGQLVKHALSGSDKVSYPSGRGKVSALWVGPTHSNGHRWTWFSSGLLGQTCSQLALLLYLPLLSERKHLVEWCLAWNIPKEEGFTEITPQPTRTWNCTCREPICKMLLWKAADKSDPPDVQLTDYGWEVREHEPVMPAISREPAAPSKLMDVISFSCKAEGRAWSGRCSYGSNGMSCTSYCVCEGGMLAVTHILNRRRTKATYNRVKWIMMILRCKRVIDWAHDRRY